MGFEDTKKLSAIVVGGGLVGALCVGILAKRGYDVTMYEKREDIRKSSVERGRSINLALSYRGRKALRLISLETEILKNSVPMKGRFLHSKKGVGRSVLYDPIDNQCIFSISRNILNKTLLNAYQNRIATFFSSYVHRIQIKIGRKANIPIEPKNLTILDAEAQKNVKCYFSHKLIHADFKKNSLSFLNTKTNEIIYIKADLIIGADGAFSSLRSFMQATPNFNMSQTYIEHGYMEFCIPKERGEKMVANHLHIWPREEFMMIALPNEDHSWTVTLFMPFVKFATLDNERKLLDFFYSNFADSVPLIGEEELVTTFFSNKPSALVSIKCSKYHVGDGFLIIGDAAHAMVPFYGQGMNAGFEDCSILNEILDKTNDNIGKTIRIFSDIRKQNAHAICDLAMYNYVEMRDLVTKPSYKLRRILDTQLEKYFPDFWIPLYNSVSFSHIPYSECVQNRQWQDKVLKYTFAFLAVACVGFILGMMFLL